MTIPANTSDTVKALFYKTLYEITTHLDFDRVTKAVAATKFGWARIMVERGATEKDILCRAQSILKEVAESALTFAITKNREQFVGSGGFEALVRPTGQVVEVKFVLECWDTYTDDDYEDDDLKTIDAALVTAEEP
jgi:hypothetical protein